jgi:hypothetical protein
MFHDGARRARRRHGPVAVRFGGPAGYETRAANELR